jgi:hypothetical protein
MSVWIERDKVLGVGNCALELRCPQDAELEIKLETIDRGVLRSLSLRFIITWEQ